MKRHINTHIHPGRIFLEEVIKPNNLKIGEVAELLQVSRLTVSKIVNEKSSITPNIALRIQTVFGGSADIWTRMQNQYDMALAIKEYQKNHPNLKRFEKADN
jgi:antitoxin HigA-1